MARDKSLEWKTLALFIAFPLLGFLALIFFPITIMLAYWLYVRGKRKSLEDAERRRDESPQNG